MSTDHSAEGGMLHSKILAATGRAFMSGESDAARHANLAYNVVRAVVELHAPFSRSTLTLACRACSTPIHTQPNRYAEVINWPCSTIQVIAEKLGIKDEERIEEESGRG